MFADSGILKNAKSLFGEMERLETPNAETDFRNVNFAKFAVDIGYRYIISRKKK